MIPTRPFYTTYRNGPLVDERDVQRLSRVSRETQQAQLLANAREWDRYSTPERHVIVRSATAARLGVRRDLVLRR